MVEVPRQKENRIWFYFLFMSRFSEFTVLKNLAPMTND